jgi:hypothetical protein
MRIALPEGLEDFVREVPKSWKKLLSGDGNIVFVRLGEFVALLRGDSVLSGVLEKIASLISPSQWAFMAASSGMRGFEEESGAVLGSDFSTPVIARPPLLRPHRRFCSD